MVRHQALGLGIVAGREGHGRVSVVDVAKRKGRGDLHENCVADALLGNCMFALVLTLINQNRLKNMGLIG